MMKQYRIIKKIVSIIAIIILGLYTYFIVIPSRERIEVLRAKDRIERLARVGDLNTMIKLMKEDKYVKKASLDFVIRELSEEEMYGKKYIPFFIEVINNTKNAYSRVRAESALVKIGDSSLEPLFLKLLKEIENRPGHNVKDPIVRFLSLHGTEKSVPVLEAILLNTNENVFLRTFAVEGLGRIGTPKAIEALKKGLSDPDSGVRENVELQISFHQTE